MKKQVTKHTALFWFIVGAIWLLTFCLDFINPDSQLSIFLLHGGCAIACFAVGISARIRYKKQQEEVNE